MLRSMLQQNDQEGGAIANKAQFSVGDLVHHKLFDYRGVIADVDPCLMLSDEWYDQIALSRPPKDEPWYRVLVHNAVHETYVAERNLAPDTSGEPVRHPLIDACFSDFSDGHYTATGRMN
jgi:heat shock protein HspQ